MIQVFMLVLMIGIGEERYEVEEKMYFKSVEMCNATAKSLSKRWGHWMPQDQATAYCIPHAVAKDTLIY